MTLIRLIASAAYVDQELSAEFGRIPPAFLPIGTSRLYEAQITCFGRGPVYLTVPEGYAPQPYDQRRLHELDVTLLPVPEGLRLGESIVYALNIIAAPSSSVRLLHGDTLINNLPPEADDNLIAIHAEGDDYSWATVEIAGDRVVRFSVIGAGDGHNDNQPVVCGYFAFDSSALLTRALTRARGDFIAGLNIYAQEHLLRSVMVKDWRDFGHIQTYFRSRQAIATTRSFNTLRIKAFVVRKSSVDCGKMQAEGQWFEQLPPEVQPYGARLLRRGDEDGTAFYETEYQYAPTLAELFVFSSIGRPTWRKILRSCHEFLEICAQVKSGCSGDAALANLTVDKTIARLERYATDSAFEIDKPTSLDGRPMPSLLKIAEAVAQIIDLRSGRSQSIMHGDFCFSNILYNSRAARIAVIDPRGYLRSGAPSIFGDTRYDLAKLSHSINGRYDHILAGRYALRRSGSRDFAINFETNLHDDWLRSEYSAFEVDGISTAGQDISAVTVSLFLSMLPLHADRPDRQIAFIANALRLFAELEGPAP